MIAGICYFLARLPKGWVVCEKWDYWIKGYVL